MSVIRLGPAGCGAGLLELSKHGGFVDGVKMVATLGLQAMEVEFTQGVRMTNETAKELGKVSKNLDIRLSVHAPFWINFASLDLGVRNASRVRIISSCEKAQAMGAKDVVFHAAYYGQKYSKVQVHGMVTEAVLAMQDRIRIEGWSVKLAPETTGKTFQWGDLDEIIKLAQTTGCSLCVDFAHIYARNRGYINYGEIFDKLEVLNVNHIHSHFSGIEYYEKGERRHLVLNETNPPFEPLAKEILKRNVDITIISESPITWKDSLKMRGFFERLGYRFLEGK